MDDWRSKPRTGKSQFYPVKDEVQRRRNQGETLRQIHDDLTSRGLIAFGYDQFIKYVRKTFKKAPEPSAAEPAPIAAPHPFAAQAAPTVVRRDADDSLHSSVPDRSRIYGTTDG
jgi:hypothetical protein